jgi:superoxide reductase
MPRGSAGTRKEEKTMAQSKQEIYKCEICGNMIEKVNDGGGPLVCCGQDMTAVTENTTEAATEKHIPVVEAITGGYKVTVGSVNHPMEEKHYIEWIEIIVDNKVVYRKNLAPSDPPVAEFQINAPKVKARAYCNLHGLWTSE